MLDFREVTFGYPEDEFLMFDHLSFHVDKGEFTAMIGASGVGKSTIFRLINRFLTAETGHILVDGKDIGVTEDTDRKKKKKLLSGDDVYCGYMPQRDLLFPWRTVEENVMLPMQIRREKKAVCREKAGELLARVGLRGYERKYPSELSGGMRQRASFARTLAVGAKLLLLDEPFSALDAITRASMQEWLREQWNEMDKTVFFITHDVDEAIFLSQRILVLTGRPGCEMKEFRVPLPANRTRDMMEAVEVRELKEQISELLRKEALQWQES
uniref:ABC transporter ATP-binding protein n=1 Tax=Eubacterium cellulosolvens TaxID=29322 RepID=UPI000487B281|nr:ABC transporter ATP-binding protein [[Eubacterium] cellulosolvens]